MNKNKFQLKNSIIITLLFFALILVTKTNVIAGDTYIKNGTTYTETIEKDGKKYVQSKTYSTSGVTINIKTYDSDGNLINDKTTNKPLPSRVVITNGETNNTNTANSTVFSEDIKKESPTQTNQKSLDYNNTLEKSVEVAKEPIQYQMDKGEDLNKDVSNDVDNNNLIEDSISEVYEDDDQKIKDELIQKTTEENPRFQIKDVSLKLAMDNNSDVQNNKELSLTGTTNVKLFGLINLNLTKTLVYDMETKELIREDGSPFAKVLMTISR